jgi:hypothetical protein
MRLFACACCRCLWHLLTDSCGRQVVEIAERYADGLLPQRELQAAYNLVVGGRRLLPVCELGATEPSPAQWAAESATLGAVEDYRLVAATAEQATHAALVEGGLPALVALRTRQCSFLRDIFQPFRPLTLAPTCRTPTIFTLAQAAYDNRELPAGTLNATRLAVLADALEDVGADATILAHLRGSEPHVRGCWAVDHLMGRE